MIPDTTFGSGDFAFDDNGNLILSNQVTQEVISVDRLACIMSTLATVSAADRLMSIVYHEGRNTIYTGTTDGEIYAVNPSSGAYTFLVDIGFDVNGLVVAPDGYGAFGDQLIAAISSGELVAVNAESGATTVIVNTGGTPADLVFASDGTLYVVNESLGEVLTISAVGMTSTLATGFGGPDGIVIDETGGRLLVAAGWEDILYGVRVSDGVKTDLGSFDFDDGGFPSGLAFDGFQTLLMGTGENSLTILALTL